MPIYLVTLEQEMYVKADSESEAADIAHSNKYTFCSSSDDWYAIRIKPGDHVEGDCLYEAPVTKRGDTSDLTIADYLDAERERAKNEPTLDELELAGQKAMFPIT